jgi:hypothetical protein
LPLALALAFVLASCGDDDDDNDAGAADDDNADDDNADDDAADDDDNDDDSTWTGTETVSVATPDGTVPVALNGLPAFTWNDPEDGVDKPAILLSTVVNAAFAKKAFDPADYKYNFAATDGYNVLNQKFDGDYRALPAYDQLAQGWFIAYEDEDTGNADLRVIWDEALNFPKSLGVKLMNGGSIQMVENILFDQSVTVNVSLQPGGSPTAVNLSGLPAFYDGETLAVCLHLIVLEAALEGFDPENFDYEFNFVSNDADGNWSLADNLDDGQSLPVWLDYDTSKDVHHGWIEDAGDDGYRLFWDEATGFTGKYGVKHMDDGEIQAFELTK